MSEIELLETVICFMSKGELLPAAELLDQSSNAMVRENAANCRRLIAAPNAPLEQMLLYCLEQQLSHARVFHS